MFVKLAVGVLMVMPSGLHTAYTNINNLLPGFTTQLAAVSAHFFATANLASNGVRLADWDVWSELSSSYLVLSSIFPCPVPDEARAAAQSSALAARRAVMPWMACSGAHLESDCQPGAALQECGKVSPPTTPS